MLDCWGPAVITPLDNQKKELLSAPAMLSVTVTLGQLVPVRKLPQEFAY